MTWKVLVYGCADDYLAAMLKADIGNRFIHDYDDDGFYLSYRTSIK